MSQATGPQADTVSALTAAHAALTAALASVAAARDLWDRDASVARVDGGAFPFPDRFGLLPTVGAAELAHVRLVY